MLNSHTSRPPLKKGARGIECFARSTFHLSGINLHIGLSSINTLRLSGIWPFRPFYPRLRRPFSKGQHVCAAIVLLHITSEKRFNDHPLLSLVSLSFIVMHQRCVTFTMKIKKPEPSIASPFEILKIAPAVGSS